MAFVQLVTTVTTNGLVLFGLLYESFTLITQYLCAWKFKNAARVNKAHLDGRTRQPKRVFIFLFFSLAGVKQAIRVLATPSTVRSIAAQL
jgi:hypothetical protein